MRFPLAIIAILLLISALPMASAEVTMREAIPDVTMDEDETALSRINLNDHFSNDYSQISFSSFSTHNKIEVTIHENGNVDFSAPRDWYGTDEVTFIASDGEHQVSDTILVIVEPVNDPVLLLKALPDFTFEEDGSLEGAMNLYEHFQDIDSILAFSYSSVNIIVQINDNGYVDFSAPNNWYGSEEVLFSASDGEFEVSDGVLVTVTALNDAPRCEVNIASISLNADQHSKTLVLGDYFTDVDDEVLAYKIAGNKRIKADINAQEGQLILKAPEGWSGEEVLILTAEDPSGGASSVQIVVITSRGTDSSGQVFYLFGLVLAVAIAGVRLQLAGKKRAVKSPVKLSNYRHYRDE
jgi:hypothetical protein